jgi:ribosomal protein S18 acetylase RimI-like enzyme
MELTFDDDVVIREAEVSDIPVLASLGASTFHDTFAPYNTKSDIEDYIGRNFSEEQVDLEHKTHGTVFLLATAHGNVWGYAKMRTHEPPEELAGTKAIELERIYAVKDQWGKSIGKSLMRACLEIAGQRGFDTIWLGVWEHNPRAIAFYEKWGFEKFSSHPFHLGKDLQTDVMMKLDLNHKVDSLSRSEKKRY